MNLNELKPLWKSYQDQVDQHDHWSKAQLSELLKQHTATAPWYARSGRALLNLCVSLLLISIHGC